MNNTILEKAKRTYELLAADEACKGHASQVKHLIEKLENRQMSVSIIGQFKRGKSSLSNAILEDKIMPVGIVPITSAVTKVMHGPKAAEVRFMNGVIQEIEFEELSAFISEQENANNERGVEEVVLHCEAPFLKDGLVFVDTPGVGSFHQNNTETAYLYMKESDAVIFLLSVDSPINQIEIDFLQGTKEFAGKFYFAVNKVDAVGEDDLKAYMDYCEKILRHLMETKEVKLFPVSAKFGQGIDALKETVLADSKRHAEEILEESTEKKLKDAISGALRQLDFYWKAMNMEYKELDEKFEAVNAAVASIKAEAAEKDFLFEMFLNEYKLRLSQTVLELFGMEYHYDIDQLPAGIVTMKKDDFLKKVDDLCRDLLDTLNRILLYREENAYTVVRRINAINRLIRSLRTIRDGLN